jgi:HEPN domain-containing protein
MNFELFKQLAMQDGAQYAWLRQSLNDFEMANILFAAKKWDGACYHAQQAVEKLLKFIISDTGTPIRFIHSVHELAKDVNRSLGADLFDDALIDLYKELSQYSTIARYPSSGDAPVDIITKKQAISATNTFNKSLKVLNKIYEQN